MSDVVKEDEFSQMIDAMMAEASFRPGAYYDANGDCIEFIIHPDQFVGKVIDGLLTLYLSINDPSKIVGGMIKGVSCMEPGLMTLGSVEIDKILFSRALKTDKAGMVLEYQKLANAVRGSSEPITVTMDDEDKAERIA